MKKLGYSRGRSQTILFCIWHLMNFSKFCHLILFVFTGCAGKDVAHFMGTLVNYRISIKKNLLIMHLKLIQVKYPNLQIHCKNICTLSTINQQMYVESILISEIKNFSRKMR